MPAMYIINVSAILIIDVAAICIFKVSAVFSIKVSALFSQRLHRYKGPKCLLDVDSLSCYTIPASRTHIAI